MAVSINGPAVDGQPDDFAADEAKSAEMIEDEVSGAQAPEASAADEAEAVEAEVIEEADVEAPASEADEEAAIAAEVEEAIDPLLAAQAEVADWKDKYLRLHAEWDTYRRRTNEQRVAERARATEKLMEDLIPVIDDFSRTIDYAEKNGETGLLDGVKAVSSKFMDVLGKNGLEEIDPAGEPYDALVAQAVGTEENPDVPEETVASVYQKGYRMGTKVLRSAMVTTTTGGPVREKPADEDANG